MKNPFKKILFGDTEITEYSTITIDKEIPETVYLETKNASIDISKNQYVLCLNPVVFGVWFENKDQVEIIAETNALKICFYSSSIKRKKNITKRNKNLFLFTSTTINTCLLIVIIT